MSAGMQVDDLARIPLAFPTYTGNLAYAAADAARQLDLQVSWQATKVESNTAAKLRVPAEAARNTGRQMNVPMRLDAQAFRHPPQGRSKRELLAR
jgi:hypothetical protein